METININGTEYARVDNGDWSHVRRASGGAEIVKGGGGWAILAFREREREPVRFFGGAIMDIVHCPFCGKRLEDGEGGDDGMA